MARRCSPPTSCSALVVRDVPQLQHIQRRGTQQHTPTAKLHTLRLPLTPAAAEKGGVFRTNGVCKWTVHKQDSKAGASKAHKAGDVNHYPEYNSNVIPRLGNRRYRLYQVRLLL